MNAELVCERILLHASASVWKKRAGEGMGGSGGRENPLARAEGWPFPPTCCVWCQHARGTRAAGAFVAVQQKVHFLGAQFRITGGRRGDAPGSGTCGEGVQLPGKRMQPGLQLIRRYAKTVGSFLRNLHAQEQPLYNRQIHNGCYRAYGHGFLHLGWRQFLWQALGR